MIRNHEQWVCSSTILTYWAVMTYLRSSSSSYHLEIKKAKWRTWNAANEKERIRVVQETFLIVNMLDENLMNYTMIWEIWQYIGNSGKRKNWEKWERRSIAINTFILCVLKKKQDNKSRRWKASHVKDKPCRGYWDLHSRHDNFRSYFSSEMRLQKFPDQLKFQSWKVNFQVKVCAKAKNLALVLQWIKRLEQPARWRTSSI